jgi:hypothetical protein
MQELDIIKLNIRQMAPRPFGEKLCETAMRNFIEGLGKSDNISYDGSLDGKRVEMKFSRVIPEKKKGLDLLTELKSHNSLSFVDSKTNDNFTCNIQQVKPGCFDTLIYGLLFDDKIYVFKITSDELNSDPGVKYSDRQHRGNVGEGQFHINRKRLQHHIDNYLYAEIDWNKFITLL